MVNGQTLRGIQIFLQMQTKKWIRCMYFNSRDKVTGTRIDSGRYLGSPSQLIQDSDTSCFPWDPAY